MMRTIVIALLLLSVSASVSYGRSSDDAIRTIDTLAELRDQARADALTLRAACAPTARCGLRYELYGMLFNRTVQAFDVMIDGMTRQIEARLGDAGSTYHRYTIEDAAVQYCLLRASSEKLKNFALPGAAGRSATDLNRDIRRIRDDITESFGRLAAAIRYSLPQERNRIVRTLAAVKWHRFQEPRPRAEAAGHTAKTLTR